jgi:hypothetical protein
MTMPPVVAMAPIVAVPPMPTTNLHYFSLGGTRPYARLIGHSVQSLGICWQGEERRRTERENCESCFDTHGLPPSCARAISREHDGSGNGALASAN